MVFINEGHSVGEIELPRGTSLGIGDKLLLIPYHVCPVITLYDVACGVRDDHVVGMLDITARGQVR